MDRWMQINEYEYEYEHVKRALRITHRNSIVCTEIVCVDCGHRSSQLWAVPMRSMIYLPSGGRRWELYVTDYGSYELSGATSRSFLHGQYFLSILWTVVHGYHSVTFQEAWNVCWSAWVVWHHIAILTDFWIYGMHTCIYIL